jgi:2-isopropylmalate synthase
LKKKAATFGSIGMDTQDRGLGVINSIAAIQAGADQVHGTALGIGERVGNTPMDQLLVNLKLMGWITNDVSRLGEILRDRGESLQLASAVQLSCVWRDAFRTQPVCTQQQL